jgi:hypothetical protein
MGSPLHHLWLRQIDVAEVVTQSIDDVHGGAKRTEFACQSFEDLLVFEGEDEGGKYVIGRRASEQAQVIFHSNVVVPFFLGVLCFGDLVAIQRMY